MLRNVALKTIRDGRRGLFWWSAGIVAFVLLTDAFYPSIKGDERFNELIEDYPDVVKAFVGDTQLATPEGYLNSQLFSFMIPLLLMIYAVGAGARAVAGEEEAGTLDLLLSNPVSRTRLVLEKALAMAVQLALLALVLFGSIAVPAPLFSLDIGAGAVAAAVAATSLLALVFGSLALLVGAATGSRAAAIAIPAVLAIGAYLLNVLGEVVDPLEPWRVLSPFRHVGDPLRDGLGLGALVLALLALVPAVVAPYLLERRDVAV